MKKIILILVSILFASNVFADHYKKKINIKEFSPKQHCSKKKSLLVPASKVFPGGEFIKFNSYSGFDQRAVIVGAHKKHPIEITSYLLLPKGSDKVPIVIWAHASGGADAYIFSEFINSGQKKLLDLGIGEDAGTGITLNYDSPTYATSMTMSGDNVLIVYELTTPYTRLLKTPLIKVAFATTAAIGAATVSDCIMWVEEPSVTITIQ
jgi:hypothetical protein